MSTFREYYEKLKSGQPGERFKRFHEFRNEHREESVMHSRAGTICVGIGLILFGLAIGWLPGPGGVIGILGLAILGAELKPVAVLLDDIETKLRDVWEVSKKRWRNAGIAFRSFTVLLFLIPLATGVWLAMGIPRGAYISSIMRVGFSRQSLMRMRKVTASLPSTSRWS